ncbi:MAG: hypothetical protein H6604_02615 [Flavobacteriales bacterium]|nr:hypothetical protein [Flavobacteriales bacterium]
MTNKLILFSLFISSYIFTQNVSISPYSSGGLGEYKFDNNATLNSMGGIGSAYTSELGNEVNFTNPAANSTLFYTTFNLGVNSDLYNLESKNTSSKKSSSYVSNLSLGFPINDKIKFGVGFQPYTGTGYNIKYETTNEPSSISKFTGNGGLNSLHTITSYSINKKLSIGVRLNYIFGNTEKTQEINVENSDLIKSKQLDYDQKTFQITPGFTYNTKLGKNHKINFGGTYGISSNLNTDFNLKSSTYYYLPSGEKYNESILEEYTQKVNTKFPANYTLGVSVGKEQKWMLGLEYKNRDLGVTKLPEESFSLSNQSRIALGGWVIPNRNSYKSYFSRATYRFGTYYEKTGVAYNGQDINQFGINFGIGLPVGNTQNNPSMLNIGFELGRRGNLENGLFRENFGKIKIGFNLNNRWFTKVKYN